MSYWRFPGSHQIHLYKLISHHLTNHSVWARVSLPCSSSLKLAHSLSCLYMSRQELYGSTAASWMQGQVRIADYCALQGCDLSSFCLACSNCSFVRMMRGLNQAETTRHFRMQCLTLPWPASYWMLLLHQLLLISASSPHDYSLSSTTSSPATIVNRWTLVICSRSWDHLVAEC